MVSGTEASGRRPSMADVGRAAHVSAQTVSRYHTGGYVSPDARKRIERAVRDLGYQHSRLPGILRSQHTDTLGFITMGPLNFGNTGSSPGSTAPPATRDSNSSPHSSTSTRRPRAAPRTSAGPCRA